MVGRGARLGRLLEGRAHAHEHLLLRQGPPLAAREDGGDVGRLGPQVLVLRLADAERARQVPFVLLHLDASERSVVMVKW